jgi:hypothetical protein
MTAASDAQVGRPTCYRCHRPSAHCYCALVPRVDNRTRIIILQHPRERFHPIGTARIASFGLMRVELLVDHACTLQHGRAELELPEESVLLYPGPESRDIASLTPEERPKNVVVIDGTWHHARTMFRERIDLHGKGVRLVGIGVSGLVPAGSAPGSLFPDPATERSRKLATASDAVNDKLGDDVVTRASLLRRKSREASSLPTVD